MTPFDLPTSIMDEDVYRRAVRHMADREVALPTFSEIADPTKLAIHAEAHAEGIDPQTPDPRNLMRVHWYNDAETLAGRTVPAYILIPKALSGVDAVIAVMLGRNFPMIRAHKVLAAYACLAPKLAAGLFDPTAHRAVWPSTGNYCRGGVAISRILGCRGVAVLPEGMSAERFRWLERWVTDPADIVRTPGSESNVKEIYDACAELETDPCNVILNQFSEFANYVGHYSATGPAAGALFEALAETRPNARLAGFVSATGSAGTIAAGDYLKTTYGADIVTVEPVECPTLRVNGYGEHNIQGIGDKHVPLIHNVMNADHVCGVSDAATNGLDVVFNTEIGQRYLVERRGVDAELARTLDAFGFSGIANMLGAIRLARKLALGPDDVIVTIATDGSELYDSERESYVATEFRDGFDTVHAAEIVGEHLLADGMGSFLECRREDRERMFNLGYYTWVEQQGIALEDFDRRKRQDFWRGLADLIPVWDGMIERMNHDTGMRRAA